MHHKLVTVSPPSGTCYCMRFMKQTCRVNPCNKALHQAQKSNWFSQVNGASSGLSDARDVQLYPSAASVALDTIGIYGIVPQHALHPEETFSLALFANAGSNSVNGFQVKVIYDQAILQFQAVQQADGFMCVFFNMVSQYAQP